MGTMKKKDIEYFQNLLTNWRENLIRQAGGTVASLKDSQVHFPDPVDQASYEESQNFMLRIKDRESRLIRKIDEALFRLQNGTYGICEMCEEEISVERLKARPVTTFCIRCKTKMEAAEKLVNIN
jgi:DnaK suppressor protein